MTIAIITQPLYSNYGGLLQNWALQQVLRKKFCADTITFDQVDSLAPLYLRIGSAVKNFLLHKEKSKTQKDKFQVFIDNNICRTKKAKSLRDFRLFDKRYKPDVYIVGSDQVWRPSMVFNLKANFLMFTHCQNKIAYAASFGVGNWEFSATETAMCIKEIRNFKGISLREDEGVDLCRRYLRAEAVHVLDPTMLIEKEEYSRLAGKCSDMSSDYVFTYILDTDADKRKIAKQLIKGNIEKNANYDMNGHLPDDKMSVECWLKGIRDSKMVVCDSFHGVAFSIIMNKEFWVLMNPRRGNSRILSILKQFELSDRVISSNGEIDDTLTINWTKVNSRLEKLKALSINYLRTALQ